MEAVSQEALTVTEQAIVNLLGDRRPHSQRQVLSVLYDELASVHAVRFHIFNLRRKLRPDGLTVVSEKVGNNAYYRLENLSLYEDTPA